MGPNGSTSSFLQRKEPKKPSGRLKPRALEGQFDPEVGSQAEGAEDELEIRVGPSAVGGQVGQAGEGVHPHTPT